MKESIDMQNSSSQEAERASFFIKEQVIAQILHQAFVKSSTIGSHDSYFVIQTQHVTLQKDCEGIIFTVLKKEKELKEIINLGSCCENCNKINLPFDLNQEDIRHIQNQKIDLNLTSNPQTPVMSKAT